MLTPDAPAPAPSLVETLSTPLPPVPPEAIPFDAMYVAALGRAPAPLDPKIARGLGKELQRPHADAQTFAWHVAERPHLFARKAHRTLARLADPADESWLLASLRTWREAAGPRYRSLTVCSPTATLVRALLALGFHPNCLTLSGRLATARARLRDAAPQPDLELRPATAQDLPAIDALSRAIANEPDNAVWQGAQLPHQRHTDQLRPEHYRVLFRSPEARPAGSSSRPELLGLLGHHAHAHVPGFASFEIIIARAHRCQGHARRLYRSVLDALDPAQTPLLRGASIHPATLHLALEMGRTVEAVYFDATARPASRELADWVDRWAATPT